MEDLFREAAENYQLPTEKAFDWNKISTALSEEKDPLNVPTPGKKNKRRFVLWYLLFIPLGWFAHYAYNYQARIALTGNNNIGLQQSGKTNTLPPPAFIKETEKESAVKRPATNTYPNTAFKNYTRASYTGTINLSSKNITADTLISASLNKNKAGIAKKTDFDVNNMMQANALPATENIAVPAQQGETKITNQQIKDAPVTLKNKAQNKKGGFYAGLLFAPDISFIKFQKISGIGSSFGLVAGYTVNKHWSIETGIVSDKKNYYTKGEYFDKVTIPDMYNKTLVSVDGNCRMLEIPMDIRYRSGNGSGSAFIARAGASSYFMKEEYYNYSFVKDGQSLENSEEYDNSSKKIFAVINLGAGYERRISNTLLLRFEPYAKIPVRKIGTGNLSISSTGINLCITKSFH